MYLQMVVLCTLMPITYIKIVKIKYRMFYYAMRYFHTLIITHLGLYNYKINYTHDGNKILNN